MTPHEELIELKGIVPVDVWPECITQYMGKWMFSTFLNVPDVPIQSVEALAIVRDAVETKLLGEEVEILRVDGKVQYQLYMPVNKPEDIPQALKDGLFYSLPDAVRYVVESGEVTDD